MSVSLLIIAAFCTSSVPVITGLRSLEVLSTTHDVGNGNTGPDGTHQWCAAYPGILPVVLLDQACQVGGGGVTGRCMTS